MKSALNLRQARQQTHLRYQARQLTSIPHLGELPRMLVLYLYDNSLTQVDNLLSLPNLTHLYLNNNRLTSLNNLHQLGRLEKLYASHNRLSVVGGLESLGVLQELHLQHQRLQASESLVFEPDTLHSLARCLRVLDVSSCQLYSLNQLRQLRQLEQLSCCHNRLDSVPDVAGALCCLTQLRQFDAFGNPVSRQRRFRDAVVISCPSLRLFDGRAVSATFRQFAAGLNQRAASVARRDARLTKSDTAAGVTCVELPNLDDVAKDAVGDAGMTNGMIDIRVTSCHY